MTEAMMKSAWLGCPMQGDCKLGEGEKDGGRYRTPADLSADALAMLTFHMQSHDIRQTTKTRAQKAKAPTLNLNLTDQQWERWKSTWLMCKL